jgi:ketosteroid isomerase-like protein
LEVIRPFFPWSRSSKKDVDGRDKPGHDGRPVAAKARVTSGLTLIAMSGWYCRHRQAKNIAVFGEV